MLLSGFYFQGPSRTCSLASLGCCIQDSSEESNVSKCDSCHAQKLKYKIDALIGAPHDAKFGRCREFPPPGNVTVLNVTSGNILMSYVQEEECNIQLSRQHRFSVSPSGLTLDFASSGVSLRGS